MEITLKNSVRKVGIIVTMTALIWACQEDTTTKLSPQEVKTQASLTAQDHAEILAATQDVMDITSSTFADEGLTSGRASTSGRIAGHPHNDKYGCKPNVSGTYSLDQTHTDSLIYSGSISIDYGDGSTCTDSNHVRKGKITDEFTLILSFKDSIAYSTTQSLTFEGFVKDSVQLDGTFTSRSSSGNPLIVEAKDAMINYPDGTSASWNGILTYTYSNGESLGWGDNTISITGSISGMNRDGIEFTSTITRAVVYPFTCDHEHHFIPTSGTVEINLGGVVSTIDYGDGTCDAIYTVTANGVATEYTFKRHHHK